MATLDNGPLIVPLTKVRELIAACYYWRRIVDVDTPWSDAVALDHTHIDAIDTPANETAYTVAELAALRPFAIVYQADDGYTVNFRTVSSCGGVQSGHVIASLQFNVPDDVSNDDSALGIYFNTLIGQLIWTGDATKPGIIDLAGTADYMPLRRVVVGSYMRTPEDERLNHGDVVLVDIDLHWGRDA